MIGLFFTVPTNLCISYSSQGFPTSGIFSSRSTHNEINRTFVKVRLILVGAIKLSNAKKSQLIDSLLDSYNHYMQLYKVLGDQKYKERADIFMNTLKHYFS